MKSSQNLPSGYQKISLESLLEEQKKILDQDIEDNMSVFLEILWIDMPERKESLLYSIKATSYNRLLMFLKYDYAVNKEGILGESLGISYDSKIVLNEENPNTFTTIEQWNDHILLLYRMTATGDIYTLIDFFVENNSQWVEGYWEMYKQLKERITKNEKEAKNLFYQSLSDYDSNLLTRINKAKIELKKAGKKANCRQVYLKLKKPSYNTIKEFCKKHDIPLE